MMRCIAPSPMVGEQVRPEKVKSQTQIFFDGRHLCRSWWQAEPDGRDCPGERYSFTLKRNGVAREFQIYLDSKETLLTPPTVASAGPPSPSKGEDAIYASSFFNALILCDAQQNLT